MSAKASILGCAVVGIGLILASGCASKPETKLPLTYVAVTRPVGVIKTTPRQPTKETYYRCGIYFMSANSTCAPDIAAYLEKAQAEAGTGVLKNADVEFDVPCAFYILLLGFECAKDTVRSTP